jgi:hypothetical protein
MKTVLPDHSGKLLDQRAADGDAGLKHEPMRKRAAAKRGAPRRKARPALPPQPDQHQQEDLQ